MRLNRYLSLRGVCSRREADRMIADGRVTVLRHGAGEIITGCAGDRIGPDDRVFVDGEETAEREAEKVYLLYHKEQGVVCTTDRRIPDNILDRLPYDGYLTYAGRLDADSSGLMLMTNDGDLIEELTRGANAHEKEYECEVRYDLTADFLKEMRCGVEIEVPDPHEKGAFVLRKTRPCRVIQTGKRRFTIVLTQGFNRQIRRMCRALGNRIISIRRVRIENLRLDGIREGAFRPVTEEELLELNRRLSGNTEKKKRRS